MLFLKISPIFQPEQLNQSKIFGNAETTQTLVKLIEAVLKKLALIDATVAKALKTACRWMKALWSALTATAKGGKPGRQTRAIKGLILAGAAPILLVPCHHLFGRNASFLRGE